MPTAGIKGTAIAIAGAGSLLVYAGLKGQNPLAALREVLTGKPGPVPAGKPVTLASVSDTGTVGTEAGISGASSAAPAVNVALAQLGKPYLWGGRGPDRFDCSGLISYAYRQASIGTPPTTSWGYPTSTKFRKISRAEVGAGDVLWKPGHVALAVNNSQLVEAPHTGAVVRTGSIDGRGFRMYLRWIGGARTGQFAASRERP
jgi:cell wall-associated NlpC family hydrolase